MNRPLLTIALPVFNAGQFLSTAIESIISQTYTHWELIIIDDGSTDGCFDCTSNLSDSRIKVLRDGHNKGITTRLNEIIDLAKGDYLVRMDADDVAFPHRLAMQLDFLLTNQKIDLVSSRAITFIGGQVQGQLPFRGTHQAICAKPWNGFYMPHPTWMGRIEWFKKHRYFVPEVKYAEDQELLLRSYPSSCFASINEPLLAYRLRSKIAIKGSLKARKNLLLVQIDIFTKRYQWVNLFLAIVIYVIKCFVDVLIFIGVRKRQVIASQIPKDILNEWQQLCQGVGFLSE